MVERIALLAGVVLAATLAFAWGARKVKCPVLPGHREQCVCDDCNTFRLVGKKNSAA